MRASIFISASAFAVAAFAAESSSIDPAPQTTFLAQTNSFGVVTGQPAAASSIPNQPSQALSQPPVATSVGNAASIPDYGPGLHTYAQGQGTNSTTLIVFSANSNGSTTVYQATPTPSGAKVTGTDGKVTPVASSTVATGTDGKPAAGATSTSSTGAAATMRAVAGSVVGVGAFVAAFL
jgi:hypothetical protein